MLFEIKGSEGIFNVEASFENRVYVVPYQADSVVRVEVFGAQESSTNLEEDLTESSREDTCIYPVLHALLDLRSGVWIGMDHFHD